MEKTVYAVCGLNCGMCTYYEKSQCKGCHNTNGTSYFGNCRWYNCCKNKHKLFHCGQCEKYPCDELYIMLTAIDRLDTVDIMKNLDKKP